MFSVSCCHGFTNFLNDDVTLDVDMLNAVKSALAGVSSVSSSSEQSSAHFRHIFPAVRTEFLFWGAKKHRVLLP